MRCHTFASFVPEDGTYKATIDVSVQPYSFVGDSAPNSVATKAKLMFSVIRHVNTVLGHPIMDLNHSIRVHEDSFINQFDSKMLGIWRCGQRMQRLMRTLVFQFEGNRVSLSAKMSAVSCSAVLLSYVRVFARRLEAAKTQFDAHWAAFISVKVAIIISG